MCDNFVKVIEMPARRAGENLTHLSTLLMIDIMAQLKKHTLTFLVYVLFIYRPQHCESIERFYNPQKKRTAHKWLSERNKVLERNSHSASGYYDCVEWKTSLFLHVHQSASERAIPARSSEGKSREKAYEWEENETWIPKPKLLQRRFLCCVFVTA